MDKDCNKLAVSVVLPYSFAGRESFVYVKTVKDGMWGLPGGKLDLFENGQDGIIREVFQETGLDIVVSDFLGIWDFRSERGNSIRNRVYLGEVRGGKLSISKPDEISGLGVFPYWEIRGLFREGEIRAGEPNIEPVESFLSGIRYPLSIVHSSF